MDFVKAYNAQTESQAGTIIPVEITVFEDRTFTFVLKTPPTPVLLREKAGIASASKEPGKTIAGKVTEAQVAEIAEIKMPDLNAYDLAGRWAAGPRHGPLDGRASRRLTVRRQTRTHI